MNLPILPPSRLARLAFATLLSLPAAAADPTLTITIDTKLIALSHVTVGFVQDAPSDNAVVDIHEGKTATGAVDMTMRLTQKGDFTSATLKRGGTYTLSFGGFKVNCSPKVYLTLPGLKGASQTALFTAKGSVTSSKITIKDLICDNSAKKYFQFPSDGSIKVTAPAK